jgi:hypothetical protein
MADQPGREKNDCQHDDHVVKQCVERAGHVRSPQEKPQRTVKLGSLTEPILLHSHTHIRVSRIDLGQTLSCEHATVGNCLVHNRMN